MNITYKGQVYRVGSAADIYQLVKALAGCEIKRAS